MKSPTDPDSAEAGRQGSSFLHSLRAVGWSFFGIRKSSEYEKDIGRLNPVHVIVAGILAAALFIIGLVLLVNWVLASGVAR
jgi:hypothetical protein